MELLYYFLFAVGLNLLMFIPAFIWKTDKLTDISYAVTFVAMAFYGVYAGGFSETHLVLFAMVLLWSFRLGSYLLIRIRKMGRDKRFDGMRESFWRFFKFWLFQGITVWVVMLPSIFFFSKDVGLLATVSYVGIAVWALGLIIETFADLQKYRFINNPNNGGKWIESGLWKYSRHPNYFGEITVWVGLYIFVLPNLAGLETLIALVSPVYIASIIIFVSGIPMLEKAADKRWGGDPDYRDYKRRTSSLIPWFNKR